MADIRHDDLRASGVIRRPRVLLGKQPVDWHPFDLSEAVRELESVPRRLRWYLEREPRAGSAVLHILVHVFEVHPRQSGGASSASNRR